MREKERNRRTRETYIHIYCTYKENMQRERIQKPLKKQTEERERETEKNKTKITQES